MKKLSEEEIKLLEIACSSTSTKEEKEAAKKRIIEIHAGEEKSNMLY